MMTTRVCLSVVAVFCCTLLFGVLSGCGYSTSHVTLTKQAFPPRPKSHLIEVFHEAPDQRHLKLAEVFVQPKPGTASINTKTPESCINEFKKRARELGGDAIIIVELTMAPVGTVGAGSYSGRAIAIRWTK